jgi:choline monooxygenase
MIRTTKAAFDWTLPSQDYRDPAVFERERREIFAKNWMLFSWSERLREPGDYVTGTVAGYPVFAMRDDAGRLRAFHNVCRHRGAQLLGEASGRCGRLIVCP